LISETAINQFQAVLAGFEQVSLDTLNERAMLLNRVDKKYIFPLTSLTGVLEKCRNAYSVLRVNATCITGYRTHYFDTPDLRFYFHHHHGRGNRFKIRKRMYEGSGQAFLEIKFRTNKGRTDKKRLPITSGDGLLDSAAEQDFIRQWAGLKTIELRETVQGYFRRITLLHRNKTEKVTFDLCPEFKSESGHAGFGQLVIAEVKSERGNNLHFPGIMHQSHMHEGSLSKYCLGLIALDETLKHNNFKPVYRRIRQINQYGDNRII